MDNQSVPGPPWTFTAPVSRIFKPAAVGVDPIEFAGPINVLNELYGGAVALVGAAHVRDEFLLIYPPDVPTPATKPAVP
jgi:hypothetical protein